ncbi:MAG: thioredoxin family protein [Victivallaceae bacterium]|nr:thioredoxin family protein [Victivallaceae bacterium]
MTKFELAQARSKINDRPVMIVFSGSDWCSWCMKLDAEVLSRAEFKTWADAHVEFLIADFPEYRAQEEAERIENAALAERYGIDSYPTVVLTDANGKELGRTGYRPGGAVAYTAYLESLLKK